MSLAGYLKLRDEFIPPEKVRSDTTD